MIMNIRKAIGNTISISQFSRGLAGKIFEKVKRYSTKVVMKNNVAQCVLISPEEYIHLLNEISNVRHLAATIQRMSTFNPSTTISQEQVDQEFGFSPFDFDEMDDIEFE